MVGKLNLEFRITDINIQVDDVAMIIDQSVAFDRVPVHGKVNTGTVNRHLSACQAEFCSMKWAFI